MSNQMKIAVIGDKDSVLGFKAVGFDTKFCDNVIDAASELKRAAKSGDYAIIYVSEPLYAQMPEAVAVYKDSLLPAIIPLPAKNGNTGLGIARIKASVEKAVGADILFKDMK